MNRALCLLLGLRLRGWLRRLWRTMASVRGALLIVFTAAVILLWILPNALREPASPDNLLVVRRIGPFALIGICLLNILFAANERVIAFSPAEVNFLFPGPVTRRQLLIYKIIIASAGAVFTGLLMAFLLRQQVSSFLAGFIGMTLAVMFLQLLSMAIALAGSTLGARARGRRQRIAFVVVAVVLAIAAFQVGLPRLQGNLMDIAKELEQAPVVRILIVPFQVFVNAFTAESGSDLGLWAGLGLALNLILVGVILLLDAQYLETAAAASERIYARLERMRQGGTAAMSVPTGKQRFRMFALPRWGGIGPLAWRQLTTALRSPRALLSIVLIFGLAVMPAFVQDANRGDAGGMAIVIVGLTLIGLTFFIQPLLPFDFRGDLDRMELLKSFPIPAWRLVIGQLLAPVIVVTVFQVLILGVVQVIWQRWEPFLMVIALFALPVNLLLFGLENLLFLTFPTRLVATTPGDLHLFGRNILLWVAKLLCVGVALVPPGLVALLAFALTGENWPVILTAAWLGLVCDLVGLVPLVAFAFHKFDVATDIPA